MPEPHLLEDLFRAITDRVEVLEGRFTELSLQETQDVGVGSSPTFTALTLSGLTAGRVVIAGAGGLLTGDADMTFATDTLTVTKLSTGSVTDSGLTAGRVVIAGAAGLLADDSDLTFSGSTLTATNLTVTTALTSGTVTASGLVMANASLTTVLSDAGTTTAPIVLTVTHKSSGTPAAGFGSLLLFTADSATVDDRNHASIAVTWVDATDATRKSRMVLNVVDTGTREVLRGEASGTAPMIGFLGAAAVVRPAATVDLRQALIDLGLYTTGGATPLDLNGGALTTASHTFAEAANIILGTVTGTKIGTATNQKLGFFNAAPVIQPTALTQTYATADATLANNTSADFPAGGVGTAAGGWSTAANRDLAITRFNALRVDLDDLKQFVNAVVDRIQTLGLLS